MTPYVALYRKYRPRSFAELVGQEAIAKTLASAITQQRLGHAYLFTGPRGTGKTSVARILAKSINCKAGPTATPCDVCSSCLEITNGNNLDVVEIDAASNNGVDNIRDLQDRVALAPVGGRYKIYIIDEVHMLSQGAFNALLKTLEEPPPNVIFVLATTDPHKVLPTIISRCQRFDFGRIALGPLVGRLAFVAKEEGLEVDAAGLEAIARRAHGGLRDALSLLDQMAAMAAGGAIVTSEVTAALGLLSGERLASLGQALLDGDAPTALEIAHGLLAAGHDHGLILRELLAHFRHLLVLQLAPEKAAVLDVPMVQLEALTAQAKQAKGAELTWILEVLNETEGVLRRSPQQAIWLELGLIKLATRPAIPSLIELAGRVAALEAALQGGASLPAGAPAPRAAVARPQTPPPIPAAIADLPAAIDPSPRPPAVDLGPRPPVLDLGPRPPAPDAPRPQAPVAAEAPKQAAANGTRAVPPGAWEKVREGVRQRSRPTAALLDTPTQLDRWDADGAVVFRVSRTWKDLLDAPAKKKILAEEILRVFGEGAFPRFEVGEAKPAGRPTVVVSPPAPPPPPPPPPARVEVPAYVPPTALPDHDDIPPPDDGPSAWLDEVESSRPPELPGPEASGPVAPPKGEPVLGDTAVNLTKDLFNGRVIKAPGATPV
ncbi:MAG: polymerase subunit gamma and tau [Cyanobacteria bacterium RYN_339]|nr:polymerase subunit gamma and tau [Cyanobacteria bacterium RYN_339]